MQVAQFFTVSATVASQYWPVGIAPIFLQKLLRSSEKSALTALRLFWRRRFALFVTGEAPR